MEQVFISKLFHKRWKVVITKGARSRRVVDQNVELEPMEPMATMGKLMDLEIMQLKELMKGNHQLSMYP